MDFESKLLITWHTLSDRLSYSRGVATMCLEQFLTLQ